MEDLGRTFNIGRPEKELFFADGTNGCEGTGLGGRPRAPLRVCSALTAENADAAVDLAALLSKDVSSWLDISERAEHEPDVCECEDSDEDTAVCRPSCEMICRSTGEARCFSNLGGRKIVRIEVMKVHYIIASKARAIIGENNTHVEDDAADNPSGACSRSCESFSLRDLLTRGSRSIKCPFAF